MADKTIGELPAASEVYDDSLLVMEQQGEARSVQGALIKKYAREATAAYVEEAKGHADDAKGQAEAARASADAAAESARDAADIALHPPILREENDHWWIWDTGLNDYKDSGIDAGVSLDVAEEIITGEPGSAAKVENLGTKTDPVLRFTIPQGEKGDKGDAATIEVGEVTTGEPGEAASVKNSGTPGAAKLDFVLPKGDTGRGFTILGYYDTAGALEAAVQGPQPGDAYGVGTEKPYDIYIYDADKGWVDNGPIGGVQELPRHLVVAGGDEAPVTVTTLHDNDTGGPLAPRTVVQALSGEGSEGDYVGFTADNQIGVIKKGPWPCNQNLLDNWYFVKPVNQRGQTEYVPQESVTAYGLDRWKMDARLSNVDDSKITIHDGYTNFHHLIVHQIYEDYRIEEGQTYNVSILTKQNELLTNYVKIPFVTKTLVTGVLGFPGGPTVEIGTYSREYTGSNKTWVRFYFNTTDMDIVAIKLELGDTQTLAHKEGDKWVLNEIPDYGMEFLKCQRYLKLGISVANMYTNANNGLDSYCRYSFSVPFRARPQLVGAYNAYKIEGNTISEDAQISVISYSNTGVILGVHAQSGPNCILFHGTGGFSAEI